MFIDRTAFTLFGVDIQWYGIILTTGMLVAFLYLSYQLKKHKADDEYALELFIFAIITAVIGARFLYVAVRPEEYLPIETWADFVHCINIREGGLTIIGGVMFGFFGVLLCAKKNKQPFLATVDLVAPALLIGQIIGRWGNFINQEAYGLEITNTAFQFFPIAVFIDATGTYQCATFIYEMVLNIIGLVLITLIAKKMTKRGIPTCFYFVWYGIVRSIMEFVRTDAVLRQWGGMTIRLTALYCSLLSIAGIILIILIQRGVLKTTTAPFKPNPATKTDLDASFNEDEAQNAEIEAETQRYLDDNTKQEQK